ncbi:MAG TPA: aminopeptidase P family protein [Candidatus Cybelea sp.]|nr:aminopeptidase P family protein [Candidatus Cybelea sp.]
MTVPAAMPELAAILRDAGLTTPPDEAMALLAGIAAAPPTPAGYSGVSLLGGLGPGPRERLESIAEGAAHRFDAELERAGASAGRLADLRGELERRGLHGFIVPLNDEYHGEYVPKRAQRLAWLTGFTGSAGIAVVLPAKAAVFTDGRYTLQVREQVDQRLFTCHHITEEPPHDWLAGAITNGQRLGYDPWLHTVDAVARFKAACERSGASLVAVETNPIDAIWHDQPPAPISPVVPQPLEFAGETSEAKRERVGATLRASGVDTLVLTLPESLAWLLNIRGGDVPHTPLPLGFALLHRDGTVELFMDRRKLTAGLGAHLGNGVATREPGEFPDALSALGRSGKMVQADPATAGALVFNRLEAANARLKRAEDPCLILKACKNASEIQGTRNAHRRDGAAVCRFLAWLAREMPKGGVDEIAAAARLYGFRRQNERFQDLSFSTISGAGPNGAVVHYRVTPKTNRRLEPGTLYLVDSGAQYLDGTTDITRTVALGTPTDEMRDRFTRVLKGHIALATCRFPTGTTGLQLDALARHALWQAGLDYDHGTGHGVGSYLSVHEGPQRISKAGSMVPLKPGMIVSNEPGYYKAGAFGIRIENLVLVREAEAPAGAERPLLCFETLTRAPIDRNAIDPAMLNADEIAWLNAYHADVRREIEPLVDARTAAWLRAATRPIKAKRFRKPKAAARP